MTFASDYNLRRHVRISHQSRVRIVYRPGHSVTISRSTRGGMMFSCPACHFQTPQPRLLGAHVENRCRRGTPHMNFMDALSLAQAAENAQFHAHPPPPPPPPVENHQDEPMIEEPELIDPGPYVVEVAPEDDMIAIPPHELGEDTSNAVHNFLAEEDPSGADAVDDEVLHRCAVENVSVVSRLPSFTAS